MLRFHSVKLFPSLCFGPWKIIMDNKTKQEIERLSREIAKQNKRITDLEDKLTELGEENQELRDELDFLTDIKQKKTGKQEKIAAIVTYAKNQYDSDPNRAGVKLKPNTITGILGISRRYAYDLIDDMHKEYDWAHDANKLPEYGDMEKDTVQRGIVIDFEGVHGEPVDVNKFTTPTTAKGAI